MKSNKISRRQFTKTTALAGIGLTLGCTARNQFDIILRGGMVLDGSGAKSVRLDVGIKDGRIAALDNLSTATADTIIDAKDLVIAPGFIDIHTHTDTKLLVSPTGDSKIMQGVTTEIGGNCGSSPFPLTEQDRLTSDEYNFEKYKLHISWDSTADFLKAMEERGTSLNFATMTGNGDLRAFVVGKNDIPATPEQIAQMRRVLAESMEQGSLGMSSGLEYAPSSYANTEELVKLCQEVSSRGGIYATHMRNEDDTVEEALEEALRICRETGVSTQISHLKACNEANWHKVDKLLRMLSAADEIGLPVRADRYPYIAYGTGLSIFLPLWARQGETEEMLQRLEDKTQLPEIEEYTEARGKRIGGWHRVMISGCDTDENKKWEGMMISECAEKSGMSNFEFIRSLLIAEHGRVGIVGFAMDEENLRKVLSSPLVMVGSDGSAINPDSLLGTGKPHPRYYGTFPRVLGKYSREENYFNLATAVKKMTSMPADKLGLKLRGRIVKGFYADITVFNPETVIDQATFTNPHQFPVGIDHVIVNGKLTVRDGKHTGELAGKVLRFNQG